MGGVAASKYANIWGGLYYLFPSPYYQNIKSQSLSPIPFVAVPVPCLWIGLHSFQSKSIRTAKIDFKL